MEKTLDVKGMSCGHCKMSVEGALKELDGVKEAQADIATGKVQVVFDEAKVDEQALKEAIEDQGYDVN